MLVSWYLTLRYGERQLCTTLSCRIITCGDFEESQKFSLLENMTWIYPVLVNFIVLVVVLHVPCHVKRFQAMQPWPGCSGLWDHQVTPPPWTHLPKQKRYTRHTLPEFIRFPPHFLDKWRGWGWKIEELTTCSTCSRRNVLVKCRWTVEFLVPFTVDNYNHLDVSKNSGIPKWMVCNGKP